jgi:hypothetical protein
MSRTEELLRAATRESAATVRPDSVPPLRPRGARLAHLKSPTGLGWRRGLVLPVVAAVLVVAVAALSLSLPRLLRASGPVTPTTSGPVTPSGIPRYYIAASGPREAHSELQPVDALVMDSQTGAVLATVKPPAGYSSFALFGGGAASDEEFVVAAQKGWRPILDPDFRYYESNDGQPITFFILRFDPATGQVTLQKMPDLQVGFLPSAVYGAAGGNQVTEQQINTSDVRGFALSPDGTRLAVMTGGWTPNGKSQVTTFNVLPVTAAATARSWQLTVNNKTTPDNIYSVSGGLGLSWSSDGRFLATSADVDEGVVLMLDTTRPGDSLLADSRVFTLSAKVPAGVAGNRIDCGYGMVLTDDGTEIVCPAGIEQVYPNTGNQPGSKHFNARTYKNPAPLSSAIATFSTASGDLVSLAAVTPFRSYGAAYSEGINSILGVEWASPSGGVFIADQVNGKFTSSSQAVIGPAGRTALVVVSGGQVTAPIPLPAWAASSPLFLGGDTAIGW